MARIAQLNRRDSTYDGVANDRPDPQNTGCQIMPFVNLR